MNLYASNRARIVLLICLVVVSGVIATAAYAGIHVYCNDCTLPSNTEHLL